MSYKKNISTLALGNTLAQAIPILISPILTRIYDPKDFGLFGIYMACVMVLSSLANGQYHLAIVLPTSNNKAFHISILSFIVTCILIFLLYVLILLFDDYIVFLLKIPEMKFWIYIIPISVFLIGINQIFLYKNTRIKNYRIISFSNIYRTVIMSSSQVFLNYFFKDVTGLILGMIFGSITAIIYLIKTSKDNIYKVKYKTILAVARYYKEFPRINTINNLLYNIGQYSIYIVIGFVYSIEYVGFFTLVQRVMLVPSTIIANAVGQVFYQKISTSIKTNEVYKDLIYTLKIMISSSFIIFLLIYLFIQDIFVIVFGEKWIEAGEVAMCLTPLFFFQFIRSSINMITLVYKKQKVQMYINIGMLLISLMIFFIGYRYKISFMNLIIYYSIIMSILNLFIILYYVKIVKKGN